MDSEGCRSVAYLPTSYTVMSLPTPQSGCAGQEVVAGETGQLRPGHVNTLYSKTELTEILVQQHELEAAAALIQPAIKALVRPVYPIEFVFLVCRCESSSCSASGLTMRR